MERLRLFAIIIYGIGLLITAYLIFQTKRAVRIIDGRRAAQMKGIEDQLGKLVKEWRQLESPRFNLKSVG